VVLENGRSKEDLVLVREYLVGFALVALGSFWSGLAAWSTLALAKKKRITLPMVNKPVIANSYMPTNRLRAEEGRDFEQK